MPHLQLPNKPPLIEGIFRHLLDQCWKFLKWRFTLFVEPPEANPCRNRKMDLVVLIDGTISMGYGPFQNQLNFVRSILSKMDFGLHATQLGIIQYSDKWSTSIEMELGEHGRRASVLANVSSIKYRPGARTMTGLAMTLAYEQVREFRSCSAHCIDSCTYENQSVLLSVWTTIDGKKSKMPKCLFIDLHNCSQ